MRVRFDAVTVALGGRDVVRGVSLEVEEGELLGLLGPNGSGKSTLLRTLYRAATPRTGTVRLGGEDARRMSPRAVARAVAVMLQDAPRDFDLTVAETVLLGRAPHHAALARDSLEDHRIAEAALVRAGVAELADRMVGSLSGGQRQRVMLARALAQQTPVLVLDEPSNHLDVRHQLELMSTVRGVGVTVLAALHDLNLAMSYCDRVAVLDQGRLIAVGPPRDVLDRDLVRQVFGVELRVVGEPSEPVLAFRPLAARSSDRRPSLPAQTGPLTESTHTA